MVSARARIGIESGGPAGLLARVVETSLAPVIYFITMSPHVIGN